MFLGLVVTFTFDCRTFAERTKGSVGCQATLCACLRLFWNLVMNVTHLRMLEEFWKGWDFLSYSYSPPVTMQVLKVSESLFEGVPQGLLQTYVIAKLLFEGGEGPTIVQYLSIGSSVFGIGFAFATLGRGAQSPWRACFFLYIVVQALLRIAMLCCFIATLDATFDDVSDGVPSVWKFGYGLISCAACVASTLILNVRTRSDRVDRITPLAAIVIGSST